MEMFRQNILEPFLSSLIQEIENVFDIPHHLNGFTVLDPNYIPTTVWELDRFGDKEIESLNNFYGKASNENPVLIDPNALSPQYKAYKVFVFKKMHGLWDQTKSKNEKN